MTRRIVAAFLGVVAILIMTPDRLSGEPTTTTGFFPTAQRPSPLSLYARRPGAKYEDVEARPRATVDLGNTRLRVVGWSIEPHNALPGLSAPARAAKYNKLGLVDNYAPSATNTTGDLLRVVVRTTLVPDSVGLNLPVALSCVATAADDGTVLVPYDRPPPPPPTNTAATTTPAPYDAELYLPLGEHRGRLFLTCRNSFFDAPVGNTRAVWGIDV